MRHMHASAPYVEVAPQVVFEIISPSNTTAELIKKLRFYEQYGVEELYY